MKTIICTLGLIIIIVNLYSQNLTKEISEIKKVEIHGIYGDLKIIGNNSSNLEIEITGYKELPGLIDNYKPDSYKDDNTQLGLHFESKDEILAIYVSKAKAQFANYKITLPKNTIVEIKNKFLTSSKNPASKDINDFQELLSDIVIRGIKNEIDINVFASNIKITNTKGPLILSSYAGSFNINFSKFDQDNPSLLNLILGDIKINLPADSKIDILLNTQLGKLTTNFTIKNAIIKSENKIIKKKRVSNIQLKKYAYKNIEGKINKGGNQLSISAYKADIKLIGINYHSYPVYVLY